ncbi:hypothetical protein [Chryseobacterium sp. YIM B08800]|uniref:hypothetical protein n=1 Tax=Chryseobacterium sp. YIM B08800 TaxID=2984136 RepID=UPI00224049EC|nr:hypothetical protein [Chryseobacterium sp. YIM B08800]
MNLKSTLDIRYLNGEVGDIFNEKFPLQDYENKAIPRRIIFDWIDDEGIGYGGNCNLNEESALVAFKEVYGEHPDSITADLDIRVNMANTFFTVKLKGTAKIFLLKQKI